MSIAELSLYKKTLHVTNYQQCSAATFQNAAKTKLESSLDVQTRIQFSRPN